ncbi:MAG: methyltransferase domain-containing protein [Desulfobacteraceae bacterium]|nr:MAG: methyltransferase domain-containing protein [Desulfobacteraceae bacterium]
MPAVSVTAKAEKSIRRSHPWIFSGAVQEEDRHLPAGKTVAVYAADGRWLAWGAYSPHSQIRIRIWSFEENELIDARFLRKRLSAAIETRRKMPLLNPCTALRLVNAESDGLPGLIVDRYDDWLVCQFLSAGAEHWKEVIVGQLLELMPVKGIFERSDAEVRTKEGLPLQNGILWGPPPPGRLAVELGSVRLLVDVENGHKTGFYLDQRENQAQVTDFAQGADLLNCFSYTGAFGLWALLSGAQRVTHIDASADMLALARQNTAFSGLDTAPVDYIQGNVFEALRRYRDEQRQFDMIVLDPPKFVASAAQLNRGCRGYKDINLLAFKLLRPGGILMTFSCSGLVDAMLFQKIVADAALDAGRTTRLIRHLHQAADHPVALNFPEGAYLKGLVCLVE